MQFSQKVTSDFRFDEDLINSVQDELFGKQRSSGVKYDLQWTPTLNPAQMRAYTSSKKYVLSYGERASGKTMGVGHKAVYHCIHEQNALVLIIVRVRSMATEGGLWEKLAVDILPRWKDGMGLEYSEERMNESRNRFRFVKNKFGGWSKMVLISIEHAQMLKSRIKGFEPSMVIVDELTSMSDEAFFTAVIQQVGRRPHIKGVQQYLATANPEGPSHWVYKRWWMFPEGTIKKKEDYEAIHVPISENKHNLPDGYYDRVMEGVSEDPIEYRRLVLGEWVDRPSERAIFRGVFSPDLHVAGDVRKRIVPNSSDVCPVGFDFGTANNAIVFLQRTQVDGKPRWIVFDEMVYLDTYVPFDTLVPGLLRRVRFWNQQVNGLSWVYISDDAAMNQYRQSGGGGYDAMEVERIALKWRDTIPEANNFKLREAPKFSGSVERRVRILYSLLQKDEIIISRHCSNVLDMLNNLEGEKTNFFQREHSRYSHVFDALTYPLIYYGVRHEVNHNTKDKAVDILSLSV